MSDFIQGYVSGDFYGGRYDAISSYMVLIMLATLVSGTALALSTWWGERRCKAKHLEESLDAVKHRFDAAKRTLAPDERFSSHNLRSWHPIMVAVLSVGGAAMLSLGWQLVVLPLAAAAAVTYWWHFHLRRSGIRRAAVYSLASWIMPYLVVVVTIILFSPAELEFRSFEQRAFLYSRLLELDPWTLTLLVIWTIGVLAASLTLARSQRPALDPAYVAALACPVTLCVWFANPWAWPLGAFTMVLFGHAMSRERRRRMDSLRALSCGGDIEPTANWSVVRATAKRVAPFIFMLVFSAVTIAVLGYDEVVYDWVRNQTRDHNWHWAWFDVLRTASFWTPLFACGAVGYLIMRKVTAATQVAPYLAAAILIAVMADTLFEGEHYIRQLTQSEFTWTTNPDTIYERYIQRGMDSFVYTGPRLGFPDVAGAPLGLSYMVAVVLVIGTLWQGVRGTLANFGGLLCGMAWFVIAYWISEITVFSFSRGGHYIGFWGYEFNDFLLANLTIAAIAMFAALYWGFGPGSIRTNPRLPRQPRL